MLFVSVTNFCKPEPILHCTAFEWETTHHILSNSTIKVYEFDQTITIDNFNIRVLTQMKNDCYYNSSFQTATYITCTPKSPSTRAIFI